MRAAGIVLIVAVVSLIIIAMSNVSNTPSPSGSIVSIDTHSGTVNVSAEVADNESSMRQGLMFRDSLPEFSGMLFVFGTEQHVSFWMKNTIIPLDMIFINSSMEIIGIQKNAQPCKSDPCISYVSGQPVKYVLEVNGGFSSKYGITEGDKVSIDFIHSS